MPGCCICLAAAMSGCCICLAVTPPLPCHKSPCALPSYFQWLQDFALDKFRGYVDIARGHGLPIRISETNSLCAVHRTPVTHVCTALQPRMPAPLTAPPCRCRCVHCMRRYGGGRVGISDTLAGGLWVLDALLTFAQTGARGFHLHWGRGGDLSGGGPPSVGVQTNFDKKVRTWRATCAHFPVFWLVAPRLCGFQGNSSASSHSVLTVSACCALYRWIHPFHGQACMPLGMDTCSSLLPQLEGTAGTLTACLCQLPLNAGASAAPTSRCGGTRRLSNSWDGLTPCPNAKLCRNVNILSALFCPVLELKVHALRSDGGLVRIALLNKDAVVGCNVELRVDGRFCGTRASLFRLLPGPEGLASQGGITWRGQHYVGAGTTGRLQGDVEQINLTPQVVGEACSVVVALPPASAALLVVAAPSRGT
jgi:hypothetical protein